MWRCCGAVVQAKIWVAGALIALAGCGQPAGQRGAPAAAEANADLRHAVSDPRVARFYEGRGWQSAWSRESEQALLAAIGEADHHALDKDAFLRPIQQPEGSPQRRAATPAIDRARALAVNLERRRWLERTPPATRIDVNTAAATLAYLRDGQVADVRRAVVGDPEHQTPQLGSPLFRLAANPTWT